MSEEERDILVTKRKYWTKFMKYNLANTVLVPPLYSGIIHKFLNWWIGVNGFEWMDTIIMFWAFFIIISWPLSFIMYVYHSFKIYEITKPKVLAKSSEMSLRSTQKHKEGLDEDKITRLKSIAELRDSGVLTDDEFQEQKVRILAESTGAASNQTHFSGEGEPPMEDNSRYLFYILSFLIPIAGVIIGIMYNGKPEPWHKEFGKTCLELALTAIVLGVIIGILSFVFVLSSF